MLQKKCLLSLKCFISDHCCVLTIYSNSVEKYVNAILPTYTCTNLCIFMTIATQTVHNNYRDDNIKIDFCKWMPTQIGTSSCIFQKKLLNDQVENFVLQKFFCLYTKHKISTQSYHH